MYFVQLLFTLGLYYERQDVSQTFYRSVKRVINQFFSSGIRNIKSCVIRRETHNLKIANFKKCEIKLLSKTTR